MKSIKTRILVYFMFIVVITVVILEFLMMNTVKQSYYDNLQNSLYSQIKVSSEAYQMYFSDATLHDNVLNNVDNFWRQTTAEVQIIDLNGNFLMDSRGDLRGKDAIKEDVKEALNGKMGRWVGTLEDSGEEIMAVSSPLKSGDQIVGVLRFISSLENVNKDIRKITYISLYISIFVVLISGIVSILLAKSIVGPLREVTKAAEKMATGNFKIQSKKRNDDEIGKLSDTLNFMAEEIIKKDDLKNDFISSVSHELRTPLTSIKGWAITLKSGNLEDRDMMMDGLNIIEEESDRLTGMVEELLDFSKFVSGKVTLNKKNINIAAFMDDIKMQMKPRAFRENIVFNLVCEDSLPEFFTDENRLKQVFINLLDNAFKFTPSGGVVLFQAEQKGNQLVLRVKDTGCGIAQEEIPKVKEKFYKGKNSNSKNGIGLSICDEIVRMMDGTMDIKSEVNCGTEVLVIIPL